MNLHGNELPNTSNVHGQIGGHSDLSSYYDTERDLRNPFADTSCILSPDTEHVEKNEQVRDGGNGEVQESEGIDGTNVAIMSGKDGQQEHLTVSDGLEVCISRETSHLTYFRRRTHMARSQ